MEEQPASRRTASTLPGFTCRSGRRTSSSLKRPSNGFTRPLEEGLAEATSWQSRAHSIELDNGCADSSWRHFLKGVCHTTAAQAAARTPVLDCEGKPHPLCIQSTFPTVYYDVGVSPSHLQDLPEHTQERGLGHLKATGKRLAGRLCHRHHEINTIISAKTRQRALLTLSFIAAALWLTCWRTLGPAQEHCSKRGFGCRRCGIGVPLSVHGTFGLYLKSLKTWDSDVSQTKWNNMQRFPHTYFIVATRHNINISPPHIDFPILGLNVLSWLTHVFCEKHDIIRSFH